MTRASTPAYTAPGRFLTPEPLPERLLFAERLRRMRVRFGGEWIADSEDVVLLHEPGRYPVAHFLEGRPTFAWRAMDALYEEETTRPVVLYESGFAPRWYVPPTTVLEHRPTAKVAPSP